MKPNFDTKRGFNSWLLSTSLRGYKTSHRGEYSLITDMTDSATADHCDGNGRHYLVQEKSSRIVEIIKAAILIMTGAILAIVLITVYEQ